MAVDLEKLAHAEDCLLDTASLGSLRVGSISYKAAGKITKKFLKPNEVAAEEFMRYLVSCIA